MSKFFRSTNSSELSAAPVNGICEQRADRGLREADHGCRELAHRANDGLEVTLWWHPARDELAVSGSDHRSGAQFEIRPERHLALDVYYHPYCYVTSSDISPEEHQLTA